MAKKKRRKRRYRKKSYTQCHSSNNNHHMLWMRKKWVRHVFSHKLRNMDYFIVNIPAITVHRSIHETMTDIPVPPDEFCELAYNSINEFMDRGDISLKDKPSVRLDVLISIWNGVIGPTEATVKALKRQRDLLSQGGL